MESSYDKKIKAYMEQFNCTKEEADKSIQEIEQQQMNDYYGYSRYGGRQI